MLMSWIQCLKNTLKRVVRIGLLVSGIERNPEPGIPTKQNVTSIIEVNEDLSP
jgi:hypothetical protein